MIYIGFVFDCMVFVVMVLFFDMICIGVVVGIIVFKNVDFVVVVLIDVDESNVFVNGDVVLFIELWFV